jgi:putative membrane protein
MKLGMLLAAVVGLAAATAIVGYIGFGGVFAALSGIGWRGLAFLCLYSAIPFFLLGTAWFVIDPDAPLRHWAAFIWARVIRDSGSELLPFSHIGGFVMGARAVILQGVTPAAAFSTTVVDVTTEIIAQLGFTGLGLGMLIAVLGLHSNHNALIGAVSAGLLVSAGGAGLFLVLQRRGGGLIEALTARFVPAATARAGVASRAIRALYRHPARIGAGVVIHLGAWIASGVGAWIALRLAGVDISLSAVLAIESLVTAVRSAAFVAPMGIGVQEAAYALIGPMFGLGAEVAVALSLLKRARDLAIGVPALLVWQGAEGIRLISRKSAIATGKVE